MAIDLTKEDGSGVPGANTYASLDDLAAFLAQRNLSALAADPVASASALVTAMDVLADLAPAWKGRGPSYPGQSLDWPRVGLADPATRFTPLPLDYMPPQLVAAQCAAAMYVLQGVDVLPVGTITGFVTSDQIGPIKTNYAIIPGASTSRPKLPLVLAYLKGITDQGGPALLVGRA